MGAGVHTLNRSHNMSERSWMKMWMFNHHLQPKATSKTRGPIFLPHASPELMVLMQTTAQAATDLLWVAESARKTKFERLKEVLSFLTLKVVSDES